MTRPSHVVAIGPIPPPTTGFAVITARMIELLQRSHDVTIANVSPLKSARGPAYHISRMARVLLAATKLIAKSRSANIAYIACEGDGGLAYTALLARLARALGYRIFLHHHSFGYIERPRALMRAVLRAGGSSITHVFLCETMAEAFRKAYDAPFEHTVISNAAFVPPQETETRPRDKAGITIGLLSNLNRAKGLHTFLALMEAAKAKGLPIRAILAGPLADPADAPALDAARASMGEALTYLGPVHGPEKDRFFAEIDVFVFPTTYANEAQPTVIYEALAAGCLVVSNERGCIMSQVQEHGLVVPRDADFIDAALPYLTGLASDTRSLATKRHAAKEDYNGVHVSMQNAGEKLFCERTACA